MQTQSLHAQWVSHTNMTHQTLSSKIFKTFYASVSNELKNNHNSKSLDCAPQTNGQNSRLAIKLKIKSKIKQYNITQLKKLSDFKAMFSPRWLQHRSINAAVQLFGHDNNSRDVFCFDDLDLLLSCVCSPNGKYQQQIPKDTIPNLKVLEGLLKCHDFCMVTNDAVLNEDMLLKYLRLAKPAMTWKQQIDMIEKADHALLKLTLIKLQKQFKGTIDGMRWKLAFHGDSVGTLDTKNVQFDCETATMHMLFAAKLRFEYSNSDPNDPTEYVYIKIHDFTDKDDYINLWK